MELSGRERRVLEAFQYREVMRIYHLPPGAGRNTMARLVGRGLVELVDPKAGMYTKNLGWRLAADEKRIARSSRPGPDSLDA